MQLKKVFTVIPFDVFDAFCLIEVTKFIFCCENEKKNNILKVKNVKHRKMKKWMVDLYGNAEMGHLRKRRRYKICGDFLQSESSVIG